MENLDPARDELRIYWRLRWSEQEAEMGHGEIAVVVLIQEARR
jgi:hypothetical protein